MRKHRGNVVLAAVLGLGALAGGVVVAPAIATAATTGATAEQAVGDRITTIGQALSGLVSDGTITQDQADRVAVTLDEQLPRRGHGRPGGGAVLPTAAEALGVTVQELRAALSGGRSLADVAEEQGASTDDLVDALVEAARARLDEGVADGRLTEQEADERAAGLPERIGALVEREGLGRPGPGGPPPADAPGQPQDGPPAGPGGRTG